MRRQTLFNMSRSRNLSGNPEADSATRRLEPLQSHHCNSFERARLRAGFPNAAAHQAHIALRQFHGGAQHLLFVFNAARDGDKAGPVR